CPCTSPTSSRGSRPRAGRRDELSDPLCSRLLFLPPGAGALRGATLRLRALCGLGRLVREREPDRDVAGALLDAGHAAACPRAEPLDRRALVDIGGGHDEGVAVPVEARVCIPACNPGGGAPLPPPRRVPRGGSPDHPPPLP